MRTPLVEKQIADQARVHGIPEDEVVEKIMLTETAIKRLVEPEEVASLAGWLVSDRRRHGHGRLVHDGRRMDGPMTLTYRTRRMSPVAGGDLRRRRSWDATRGCRARRAADPRGDGIPPARGPSSPSASPACG